MKPVYLLTGAPGTGKTSLIKQAAALLKGRAGGFYTEEIRAGGVRLGFRLVTLDGQNVVLAHVDLDSPYRVGKYRVNVEGLEKIGGPALRRAAQQGQLVIVDEIGKMELLSAGFRQALTEVLEGGGRLLGTVMLRPHPWADAIKGRPEVHLAFITRNGHQQALEGVLAWLRANHLLQSQEPFQTEKSERMQHRGAFGAG